MPNAGAALHECLRSYPGAALELVDGVVVASNGVLEQRLGRPVVGQPFDALLQQASREKWRGYCAVPPAPNAEPALTGSPPSRRPVELTLEGTDAAHVHAFVVSNPGASPRGRLWLWEHQRDPERERLLELLADAHSELATMHRELERERARLARALDEAEAAIHTRDDVMSVVAHDLRNPLAGISMTVDLLLKHELPPDRHRLRLESIRDAALRVQRLVRDLLEVALLEAGQIRLEARPTGAAAIVRDAAASFEVQAQARGVDLVADPLPDAALTVVADAGRIQRVLGNLLDNALRHTPRGGRVTIEARAHGESEVRFGVRDTGPGVAPNDLPHLFRRFWQSRREGGVGSAGLGLAIAKGLVEAHGGRIWAESAPAAGTAFFFTLPRATGGPE